ncbi:hypothetical protein [uncultured Jannaschia sp.]|uniref:hypothetical protein n=1 Tax=uncultured Jannaschia sp. TaxID=293347 RepID=UPI00262ADD53|nr:hypothetical protein [uncultured Jannaschia sp.]
MSRARAGLVVLSGTVLCGCVDARPLPTDPAIIDAGASRALSNCLSDIGRPDVAADPDAPMNGAEITALLNCASVRAQR